MSDSNAAESRFAGDSANYLLRHLVRLTTSIRQSFAAEMQARGHEPTFAVSQVLVNLPVGGLGMSELASRLRLTLQRTGQLVAQLEAHGYVARVPDEYDGRAKRVIYTERGRALLADIDAIDAELTKQINAVLGDLDFSTLCRELILLDEAFGGDDDTLRL